MKEVYNTWPRTLAGKHEPGYYSFLQRVIPDKNHEAFAGKTRSLVAQKVLTAKRIPRKVVSSCILRSEEAAWLAELLEGDGSISLKENLDSRTGRCHKRARVYLVSNNDPLILDQVQNLVPFANKQLASRRGTVCGIGSKYKSSADLYSLVLTSRDSIMEILPQLLPHLRGAKKERAAQILGFYRG